MSIISGHAGPLPPLKLREGEKDFLFCCHNIFGPRWQGEPHLGESLIRQISDDFGVKFQPNSSRKICFIPLS